jgi:hypothetical protein
MPIAYWAPHCRRVVANDRHDKCSKRWTALTRSKSIGSEGVPYYSTGPLSQAHRTCSSAALKRDGPLLIPFVVLMLPCGMAKS